jgi:hypothetical protein
MDSKSIGLCPQGFESPRCRFVVACGWRFRGRRVVQMTPAGLEPAIPGSVGRCLIHWATGPLAICKGYWCVCVWQWLMYLQCAWLFVGRCVLFCVCVALPGGARVVCGGACVCVCVCVFRGSGRYAPRTLWPSG